MRRQAKNRGPPNPGVPWLRALDSATEFTVSTAKTKTPPRESFGSRLARLRKEAGFTQRELGNAIGISQRMVAYYETEEDPPLVELLVALTESLGISTEVLLGVKEEKTVRSSNQRLWRRFRQIEKLPAKERRQLLAIVDTFLERDKFAHQRSASR
jgi:transcriptional regulator with XRE-family HTH domain